ncbi:MAG: DUF3489 domain-containing protein [Roseitalea porphyridii]|uniref:DUF3489 domain-containing protein n=1 Tax=Roseitalea porphyridii TaxID=1852022 RepID=UPI0032D97951
MPSPKTRIRRPDARTDHAEPRCNPGADKAGGRPAAGKSRPAGRPTKLDRIVAQLSTPEGASLQELMTLTGWQAHSVRGALAGSLKRKGHHIVSDKTDGVRRYRITVTP